MSILFTSAGSLIFWILLSELLAIWVTCETSLYDEVSLWPWTCLLTVNINFIGDVVTFPMCYSTSRNQSKSISRSGISLREHGTRIFLRFSIMCATTIVNFCGESTARFGLCYLSSRSEPKIMTPPEKNCEERNIELAFCFLFSMLVITRLESKSEAVGSYPHYLSVRNLLKSITSSRTGLKERTGRVSFSLLIAIVLLMDLKPIGWTVTSFTTFYVSGRSRLNSGTAFDSSFWEWGTFVWRPVTCCACNWLSSGRRTAAMLEYLADPQIFIYSWSLPHKVRNRVIHALNGNWFPWKLSENETRRLTKDFGPRWRNLLLSFLWTMLAFLIATGISIMEPGRSVSSKMNECVSLWPSVNLSHLLLLCWAVIASKELWQIFLWQGRCILWWMRVIVKTKVPRSWDMIKSVNVAIWEDQLWSTWSWVDDLDMDRLLRKEEDTRVFRSARRVMSKRRGWMLKSRAFKVKMKSLHIGSRRVRACNYYFSSRWKKPYTVGMRRKRSAQSTWRRLRFWMKRNPCLWKCLQTLNITVSLSDLISILDFHPEWFTVDGICLEAIRAPLRRRCLYISHVLCHFLRSKFLIDQSSIFTSTSFGG